MHIVDVESLLPSIIERVIQSSEYTQLLSSIISETKLNISELAISNSSQIHKHNHGHTHAQQNKYSRSITPQSARRFNDQLSFSLHSNTTDNSISGSISSNLSTPYDEVKNVISNLHPRNSVEIRWQAVQKLESFSTADILSSEFWNDSKTGLEYALDDSEIKITNAALKICARSFKTSPPPLTGEIYLILVNHLRTFFNSEAASKLKIDDGLNVDDPRIESLLKKVE